jgi:hypothetical protein
MAGPAEREALKQRALLALDDSRRALAGEMSRASVFLHPRQLFQDSLRKHRVVYLIGAAAAGFVALRLLLVPRSNKVRSRLAGMVGAALWPMVKGPVMEFATRYLSSYLPQIFPTAQPPEATATE